ncbi:LysM peptidoglycan-binding domain-containing protein [Fusobacterium sp.]|uniref:LysM peptidoglycan-binding domain-containing protein n=1 Tax=Fusobacterium sp. TaxID=68766 RepID=UPI0013565166|nr:LysM domain-containing protein [Fusobacterium sp.]
MTKLVMLLNLFLVTTVFAGKYPQDITSEVKEVDKKIIVKISKVKGPEVEYLIKKGDTLSEIAQKYDKDMKEIAKDNTIKNLDLIYYDKTLILK